jgi:hypothetical protein
MKGDEKWKVWYVFVENQFIMKKIVVLRIARTAEPL